MGYGDCYWGLYRDHYRDPFPHSPLRTRQSFSMFLIRVDLMSKAEATMQITPRMQDT